MLNLSTFDHQITAFYVTLSDRLIKTDALSDVARMSPNSTPDFSDCEVMAVYLFGRLKGLHQVKQILQYAMDHLLPYFPNLMGYKAFVARLSRLEPAWMSLAQALMEETADLRDHSQLMGLIDSLPIMVKKGRNKKRKESSLDHVCDQGYCATKDQYYWGSKLHTVGTYSAGSLPGISLSFLTYASLHDNQAFKEMEPELLESGIQELFADKAYCDTRHNSELKELGMQVVTPIKKPKKGLLDAADRLYSTAVSRIRQPIEALFGNLVARFDIQDAHNIRSKGGLARHVFGALAANFLAFLIGI